MVGLCHAGYRNHDDCAERELPGRLAQGYPRSEGADELAMAELPARADVVVVGAGIAGVVTAYYLARSHVNVILVDRYGPAAEASGGNAGMICLLYTSPSPRDRT